jgi:D-alanine-D-alanine ligase
LKQVDVLYNGLHGAYGEDGKIQDVCDTYGVPYTGSSRVPSALTINKVMTKDRARTLGIQTPQSVSVSSDGDISQQLQNVARSIPFPLVIKPVSSGSSIGVSIARNQTEMIAGIENAFLHGEKVLIEEYIAGDEVTAGVIEKFRGQDVYALPIVHIKHTNDILTHESKQNAGAQHVCPAGVDSNTKKEIERIAMDMHRALGLGGYSGSDFIISPRRGIYFLETNSLPTMTAHAPFPKSLEAVGVSMKDFVGHQIGLVL